MGNIVTWVFMLTLVVLATISQADVCDSGNFVGEPCARFGKECCKPLVCSEIVGTCQKPKEKPAISSCKKLNERCLPPKTCQGCPRQKQPCCESLVCNENTGVCFKSKKPPHLVL